MNKAWCKVGKFRTHMMGQGELNFKNAKMEWVIFCFAVKVTLLVRKESLSAAAAPRPACAAETLPSSAFRVRRTFHSMLLLRGCVPFPRVVKPKKVRRKKLLFKVLQPFRNSSLLAEFMLKKAFQTEETHPRSDIFRFYNQHLTWISYQLRIALEKPLYHPWKLQPCILISIHIDI